MAANPRERLLDRRAWPTPARLDALEVDVTILEELVRAENAETRGSMDSLRAEVRQGMAELKAETRDEVGSVKAEIGRMRTALYGFAFAVAGSGILMAAAVATR